MYVILVAKVLIFKRRGMKVKVGTAFMKVEGGLLMPPLFVYLLIIRKGKHAKAGVFRTII